MGLEITTHDKSYIVGLSDGSVWRIWPADLSATLRWLPTTEIEVVAIDHEVCSHALVDTADGSRVKVIKAAAAWPVEVVARFL